MKNRAFVDILKARLKEKHPLIQVLIGPRQVGKTTGLKEVLKQGGLYRTADYPTPLNAEILVEWWSNARESKSRLLAVDEVQKITNWSEAVKYLWDSSSDMKLILTGSSTLQVEKGLRETLAGRFELIRAEHWNLSEAARILNLTSDQFIEFGAYPGAVPLLKDVSRWASFIRDSIVEPAIGRDLMQLHPVENPALMRQVFGVAVSQPAQLVSLQKIQGSLQARGTVPTIGNYMRLLSEAFLVTGVQKYSQAQLRTKKSIPKLIVHDNSLCRAFEKPVGSKISKEKFGRYFENAIGARFIEAGWDVYYWKNRNAEVDYVVLGPENQKWAIEVKSSEISRSDLTGLFEFCKQNPEFEPHIISYIDQKIAGISSLDYRESLSLRRN